MYISISQVEVNIEGTTKIVQVKQQFKVSLFVQTNPNGKPQRQSSVRSLTRSLARPSVLHIV